MTPRAAVPAPAAPVAPVHVDRVVVRGTGDGRTAERLAQRLPAALAAAVAAADPAGERELRALIARAVREAAR